MEWQDQGIILKVTKHGEQGFIVTALTREHGRHGGVVRGSAKRLGGVLQPGNLVSLTWKARLAEHLGNYQVELDKGIAARYLDHAVKLEALSSLCGLLEAALPEREGHQAAFEATLILLEAMTEHEQDWPRLYIRWEQGILAELGFGLDLSSCAASGVTENLTHVSPKSGRAVSAEEAAPYKDKLLPLPRFMAPPGSGYAFNDPKAELSGGFRLTGYFLNRHVFEPRGKAMPGARTRLVDKLCISGPKSSI